MSIPTPAPFMSAYPQTIRPVANVTPFTYRDGLSYLNILETLIDYVNTKLVGYIQLSMDDIVQQLNTSIEELSRQIASNEIEYNKLLDDYMSSVEYRIMEINNKTGQLPIRRYQVTDDMVVDVEPVWPDRQQIILQFTQDYLGHDVEFRSTNVARSPLPDATNGWTSTSSQWWPGHPDINAGRRPETNGYVTRRDISGPSSVISRIENIGGINIPARHGREHTVSVYTHCTTTDDYTVQLHVSTDVENFDSPKLAATVDEQGWARTVYTFTMPTTTDVLNVSATVELAEGQSVGGEEVWWTDAQVERGSAPTAWRGVFANPHGLVVPRTPLTTYQVNCTPQPDGSWELESINQQLSNVKDYVDSSLTRLSSLIDNVRDDVSSVIDFKGSSRKTLYVSANRGSDDGDGSFNLPYKTLAKVFSVIPRVIGSSITINVERGNYPEYARLWGVTGQTINIEGEGSQAAGVQVVNVRALAFIDCYCLINISGFNFVSGDTFPEDYHAHLRASRTNYISIRNCSFTDGAIKKSKLESIQLDGSTGSLSDCYFDDQYRLITSINGSSLRLHSSNRVGNIASSYGVLASAGVVNKTGAQSWLYESNTPHEFETERGGQINDETWRVWYSDFEANSGSVNIVDFRRSRFTRLGRTIVHNFRFTISLTETNGSFYFTCPQPSYNAINAGCGSVSFNINGTVENGIILNDSETRYIVLRNNGELMPAKTNIVVYGSAIYETIV